MFIIKLKGALVKVEQGRIDKTCFIYPSLLHYIMCNII